MRLVFQKVKRSVITLDGEDIASIGPGLLVLIGLEKGDGEVEIDKCVNKILRTRVWENEAGALWEKDVTEVGGEILGVSQFTLLASVNRGTKPNFRPAMAPGDAEPLFQSMIDKLRSGYTPEKVSQGKFGSTCDVMLVNDGPTTIFFDTKAPK